MKVQGFNNGEVYWAEYYDLIDTKSVNGVTKYVNDTQPQKFKFKQYKPPTASGISKGLDLSAIVLSGSWQSEGQKFQLETSSRIDFKNYGKIRITINGVSRVFIIAKVSYRALSSRSLGASRNDGMDTSYLVKVLDLK
jgi:hypothetical protein